MPVLGRIATARSSNSSTTRPADESRDLVDRPYRGGQPYALRRMPGERIQPFQAHGQVRAPFGAGDGMDLIEYHRFDVAQDDARLGRQQQIQRFRRRDEDVRRMGGDGASLPCRRVTAAYGDADIGSGKAGRLAFGGDAVERSAEVLRDIDGQRLQRRDIQHLDTPSPTPLSGNVSRALRSGHGTGAVQTIRLSRHQAVDGREERA